jgi:hypothetical protein
VATGPVPVTTEGLDYGHIYPFEQAAHETRITCRIHANKVTLDAIHD